MLEKTFNQVVRFVHATSGDEFNQVLALLPNVARVGLAAELEKLSDAHRFDASAHCAYYFERQGTGVAVWSWNHVYRPHEAGELIFLVVDSREPLDETLANEFYARATGRTVEGPWSAAEDEKAD